MIHNKYFEIISLYTGDYLKQIYGRELIGKISLSQKGIALALKELEQMNILKSKERGHTKFYSLNLKYSQIKEILVITEAGKKIEFLMKNRAIDHVLLGDDRIVGVFGSYAKGTQKADSDIDVFVVGKKRDVDYDKKGRKFDLNISLKYFSEKEFKDLLKRKNNLIKEIIQNHIILFNVEKFINLMWREYYGFD